LPEIGRLVAKADHHHVLSVTNVDLGVGQGIGHGADHECQRDAGNRQDAPCA
jgi:hypothetical protein